MPRDVQLHGEHQVRQRGTVQPEQHIGMLQTLYPLLCAGAANGPVRQHYAGALHPEALQNVSGCRTDLVNTTRLDGEYRATTRPQRTMV